MENVMYIKKIQMLDYKRFHDLTIDLGDDPKRIVALVGPNGCGKSSVLDAIAFCLYRLIGRFGSSEYKDYHYHSLLQEPSFNERGDKIVISLDQGYFRDVFREKSQLDRRMMVSFRSCYRYNSNLLIKETKASAPIEENNDGAANASAIDARIEANYRRLLGKYTTYMKSADKCPSEAKKFIIGQLNTSLQNCLELEIDDIGDVESDKGTLFFKKTDSEITFRYEVLSAGEKEVVDILLDLYLRKDFFTDSIYVIDEPELHLNPSIQRALLIEINRMIPDNCQIWIATHSIGFIRALQEELRDVSQIIEFKPENKWASESYVLTPSTPNRTTWQNLFATALDDLSTLVCPRTIIYCEGKDNPGNGSKERGLDAQVYNIIFAGKYPNVLFVSSGGNTELDQRSEIAFAVLSKVFSTLEILVLKDRDISSGQITTEAARLLYLQTNAENHRVLKRFEIENYLFDQFVLEAYCAQNDLTFDKQKYDSVVSDIVNDQVKEITGEIKKCCGISTNINPEKFKICLAAFITENSDVYRELEEVIFERK